MFKRYGIPSSRIKDNADSSNLGMDNDLAIKKTVSTVDGRNLAPADKWFIPL